MSARQTWDTQYEWKTVTLLTLGFGLVGLDRWIIAPLLPSIQKDLGLDYKDLGYLIASLGIAWGICAVIAGGLSDRFGRKNVLVPAMLGFSVLSGITGLAQGLTTLLMARALMGIMEGSFCPTSFAATAEASAPGRRGFNLGVQQSAFPLFGLALGPILATQLLKVVDWRWIFILVAVPGVILSFFIWRIIRDPATSGAKGSSERAHLGEVMKHRNVALGMVTLMCAMSGIFVLSAMVPNYLIDYVKLDSQQMGFVTSAIGFGGFLGQVVLPGVSDVLGRKTVAIGGFVLGAALLYAFARVGANPALLFTLLFASCFFCFGLLGLITGPIATEAAPRGLISSTAGVIIGTGEIFGGGIAPALAGNVAQNFGIQHVLTMALAGLITGAVVSLALRETAPKRIGGVAREAA
jgi:predicted MFS family arabinose efflux permease